jgi:electron transfer flavoprotein beta subunit
MQNLNLKMILLIKQVPNTQNVKIDHNKGTLIREGVDSIVNPDDLHALEIALQLKDRFGGEITVVTMGPPQAKEGLYECLSMGADKGILLSSAKFAGADTWVTAATIMLALEKLFPYDILFAGNEALDGNTAQVPYQISQGLKIPLITHIRQIENVTLSSDNKKTLIIERIKGHERQRIQVPAPMIITADKNTNKVRFSSLNDIRKVEQKEIRIWTEKEFNVDPQKIGLSGSPTAVVNTENVIHKRKNMKIEGNPNEIANKVIEILANANVFKIIKNK